MNTVKMKLLSMLHCFSFFNIIKKIFFYTFLKYTFKVYFLGSTLIVLADL